MEEIEIDINDIVNALDVAFDQIPAESIAANKQAWLRIQNLARLGAAIMTAVMDAHEPRFCERIGNMHPAMRRKLTADDLSVYQANALLDVVLRLVLKIDE